MWFQSYIITGLHSDELLQTGNFQTISQEYKSLQNCKVLNIFTKWPSSY